MKILVVASLSYSLVNFRGALLQSMVAQGHKVVACGPENEPEVIAALQAIGVHFRQVPMARAGLTPLRDLVTLRHLLRTIRRERADIVLAYTQKPIVYAGIATRLSGRAIRFYAMVSGLGHLFSPGGGRGRTMARSVLTLLYRMAVASARRIFVFNGDDEAELRRHGIVRRQTVVQVPGSGIDLKRFAQQPSPPAPVFLMACRLLRDKGIAEYVAAARHVKALVPQARFQLLGPLDPNPTGISRADLDLWLAAGDVEYLGETRNVVPYLAAASVFVLPSYYREGLPRAILEAMAVGRAIVTTDMPGCREPVEPGRNGFLVPPRDPAALAAALLRFIEDPALIPAMGERSRALAEEIYDVRKVNKLLLAEMGLDAGDAPLSSPRPGKALGDRPLLRFAIAAAAVVAALPIAALVGAALALSMGRPILFRQVRSGAGGRPFTLVKFRTMRDSRSVSGQLLADDLRVTPIGRFLRRSRLDELPELWNVLRGEMSLIGPRPLLPETIRGMGGAGVRRGEVRPGLTGWAQVHGNALLSDADKVQLDLWYVANRSLALDARIALATVATVIAGERIDRAQIGRAYASAADRSR